MKPTVSIVIPTYNRAPVLERALGSVVSQTFPDWEALVVDNHSSDHTEDVVGGFGDPRIKLHKIRNHGVIAASRNLGIKHAQGEYIAFLYSDDWWLPGKLEIVLKILQKGADIVYHDMWLMRREGDKSRRTIGVRQVESPVLTDLLVNGNTLANSSVVVRRQLLEKVGGFNEDKRIIASEDYDLWLRIAETTESFSGINNCLGYYWLDESTVSAGKDMSVPSSIVTQKYIHLLDTDQRTKMGRMHSYTKARFYFLNGEYDEALPLFRNAFFAKAVKIKIKILYMYIIILFQKIKKDFLYVTNLPNE